MKCAKGFAEFQLFMRGMGGVGAASPLKLHPVPTQCPTLVWEAFPCALPFLGSHSFLLLFFRTSMWKRFERTKKGKTPARPRLTDSVLETDSPSSDFCEVPAQKDALNGEPEEASWDLQL